YARPGSERLLLIPLQIDERSDKEEDHQAENVIARRDEGAGGEGGVDAEPVKQQGHGGADQRRHDDHRKQGAPRRNGKPQGLISQFERDDGYDQNNGQGKPVNDGHPQLLQYAPYQVARPQLPRGQPLNDDSRALNARVPRHCRDDGNECGEDNGLFEGTLERADYES